MNFAGIDVGAKQLHVALIVDGQSRKPRVFGNEVSGIDELVQWLSQQDVSRVVLEATGIYHLDLALALAADPALEVMVLNPKAAHHYAKVCMQRSKSDSIDAGLLASYAQRMPFEPWQPPDAAVLALRACSRRLATLTEQRTQAKNQLHALSQTRSTPDFIVQDAELSIAQLGAQIVSLEGKTLALIEQNPALQTPYELLISIKGVGIKSALQLLGELLVLPPDMRAKQWVAMAGLDPRQHQSGSSIDKKARLTKAGNRYVRKALYMSALSATRHVAEVKAYYHHLIEERGLKKIQAVCAVMRKLLHAIHAMWRSQQPFDPSRFYAMEQTAH